MYYGPYFDLNFHYWAHQQWFKQINQQFGDLKTIHFHCFSETVKWSDYLPGCVFTTPLINFSIGELTGSDNEIRTNVGTKEVRPNHFNAQNNQAIANLIIKNIKDYQPGKYTIDPKLFHQVNPNSFRFPEPGFGTK